MSINKLGLIFGLIAGAFVFAQAASAQDPFSAVGAGVEGVGGAVEHVGQEAGKTVTGVLDHVTGNHTAVPVAPAAASAPVAAPVVHHHHHHHHHHIHHHHH
ncbi:MAG: hypothetical protein ACM3NE_10090 [Hyphomicrobiales bacterium]